ncbi:MAG: DUF4328 domain-containing protein [Myxococcota bacterium]|jgi:hypothetical protein
MSADASSVASSNSTCFRHSGVTAIAACDRCGTFGCGECIDPIGEQRFLCMQCKARQVGALPSLHGRATWARRGLWATAALMLGVELATLLGAQDNGMGERLNPGSVVLAVLGLVLVLVYITTYITTVVLFCRWFHLAVRHVAARSVRLGVTPAGAVASWFIPFVNLVRPFRISRQMLDGTGGDSSIVGPWQALWLIGNTVSRASSRMESAVLSFISSLLLIGAAFLAVRVINGITRSVGADIA